MHMDVTLILAAATLGLAGMPHCAAMCAPTCVALWGPTGPHHGPGRQRRMVIFLLGRTAGYGLAGGMAAAGVGALGMASQVAPWVRPVWALLHALALALGLWLLMTGRQPAWMAQWGRTRTLPASGLAEETPVHWHDRSGRVVSQSLNWVVLGRSGLAGLLWVTWPCGLLQSALLVASLGNTAMTGALAMGIFSAVSALPLTLSASLWNRLGHGARGRLQGVAVRLAGVMLVFGSGFALGRDVWHQVAAYCGL